MDQIGFAELEYNQKRRKTRREKFLEKMEKLIPWDILESQIEPFYPKDGSGHRPYPLSTMLRIHCMQLFYNLSDPAMEDALYEIESMRRFARLKLTGPMPDETTILNFRHLLEQHSLGKSLFDNVNKFLTDQGLMLKEGSIVDASIISAPKSTKNQSKERDPEMHQTKKGNEWHFGMKLHIGVDDTFGLVHSFSTTPANVHDITETDKLLHGEEKAIWGDAGYIGVEKRDEHAEREVEWHIAQRPGKRKTLRKKSAIEKYEKLKAQIRAKVEHPFLVVKRRFGYDKARYRGLAKNENRLSVLLAFSNLLMSEKYIAY